MSSARRSLERAPIRLDQLTNPYGPVVGAREALTASGAEPAAEEDSLEEMRLAVAAHVAVPSTWIRLWSGESLRAEQSSAGVVRLPPSGELAPVVHAGQGADVTLWRGEGFRPDLALEAVSELPRGLWAEVAVPHDPSGALLPIQGAVRLARATEMLVIDERLGGYGPRSMLPLVREYDNVVVLQSFAGAAGLGQWQRGWIVGSPTALQQLSANASDRWTVGEVGAVMATIGDIRTVDQQVRRVREERSRMFRMVRKFNTLTPIPSWAGFLLARVERGSASEIALLLADRAISVHVPAQVGSGEFLRISIGRSSDTDRLREALLEIATVI